MFVDSGKSVVEIEKAIQEQQKQAAAKKAAKRRSSKRVTEPTRMVVEPKKEAIEESSEVRIAPDEITIQTEDVKSIEGVNEIPEDAEVHDGAKLEGATINGVPIEDLLNNL